MFEQEKDFSTTAIIILAVISIIFMVSCAAGQSNTKTGTEQDRYRSAAEYSKASHGLAVVVIKGGKVVFEDYQNGYSAAGPNMLASGTKSFSGVMAAAAIEDGLVKGFDEQVCKTIIEWKDDKQRSKIGLQLALPRFEDLVHDRLRPCCFP